MARRILYTLLLAALGGAAFWLARPPAPADEGLVVHVYVTDAGGTPLKNAQAERLFDPGWKVVDEDGYRKLARLRLKADASEPSAAAIREAVRVRAPFYTLRRGFEPAIEAREDGSWEARYALHHHGVLRVHVQGTHLGPAKAYLEADHDDRWEAMDQGNVARPGSPAAFRIYPGMEHVVVRLEGEPDKDGIIAVATRRAFVPAPNAGHILEKHLVPDEVKPIIGTVVPPPGPRPPSLAGTLHVTELAPGGRRIEHEPTAIDDEGFFAVRRVGAGRYELRAAPDFLGPPEPVTVEGGGEVDVDGASPRPWVVLDLEGLDAADWAGPFVLNDAATPAPGVIRAPRSVTVALPGAGTWRVWTEGPGTDGSPPRRLQAVVQARAEGEHEARPEVAALPHGRLLVKTTRESWTRAKGATVTVGRRHRTLLPRLAEEASFEHVRAGRTRVRIEWSDRDVAEAEVDVPDGGTAEVTFSREATP